jgi:hypothetical protein
MRMDIEDSPGAPCKPDRPAARAEKGQARRRKAAIRGEMMDICLCCMGHSAIGGGRRASLLCNEQGQGVLWHHCSVNL